MEVERHIEVLRSEGERLGDAAKSAGLEALVPTCPDWAVRDLLMHVGGVHRWASYFVSTGDAEPNNGERRATFFPTVPDEDLFGWYSEGHAILCEALEKADPSLACWTFLPAPSPRAFWARRQAHETSIHRVDAELATGPSSPLSPDSAADGIDELLTGFLARPYGRLISDPPVTLAVATVDTEDAWTIRIEPDRRLVSDGLFEWDCLVRGLASNVCLLLWNRLTSPAAGVEVEGNRDVLDVWVSKAAVRMG